MLKVGRLLSNYSISSQIFIPNTLNKDLITKRVWGDVKGLRKGGGIKELTSMTPVKKGVIVKAAQWVVGKKSVQYWVRRGGSSVYVAIICSLPGAKTQWRQKLAHVTITKHFCTLRLFAVNSIETVQKYFWTIDN